MYKWPINKWKAAQHCSLLEKWKSKLQWTTSHQSEWSSSRNLQKINAGEDVEKREPSYTFGGNVNWYHHYGKEYGDSLKKKLEINIPYDPENQLLGIYLEKTTILYRVR